jgi:hypothetical protein
MASWCPIKKNPGRPGAFTEGKALVEKADSLQKCANDFQHANGTFGQLDDHAAASGELTHG